MKQAGWIVAALLIGSVALGQQNQQGQQIFQQNCAQCHGDQGGGGTGPALAGNQALQDAQMVINQIKNGGGGMPAFGDQLSDEEIAAVASYIRTSWDNSFGQVSVEQVAQGGQQGQGQQEQGQQGQQQPSQHTGGAGQAPPNSQTGGAGQPPSSQQAGQQTGQGSLEITVEPGEAVVNVIGPSGFVSLVDVTGSQTLTELEPGTYIVAATAQGRAMAQTNTEVQEGQTASVSLTLQPRGDQQQGQQGQQGQQQGQQGQQGQQQGQQGQEQQSQPQGGQQQGQGQQQGDRQAQQQTQNQQAQSQNNQQQEQAQQGQQDQQQGLFTRAQVQSGIEEYSSHCAVCHGGGLEGRAPYPPLRGEAFLSNWRGQTLKSLFDYISTHMPDDRPGTLGHQTYTDITAFILQQNGFPAGEQELAPESGRLEQLILGQQGRGSEQQDQGDQQQQGNAEQGQQQALQQGALQIAYVEPAGATVTVSGPDGYSRELQVIGGEVLTGLTPGSYVVTATRPGFESSSTEVEVTAQETASVSMTLQLQEGQQVAVPQQQGMQEQQTQGQQQAAADGQQIFQQNCAQCHGDQGGGGTGPALAGNQALQDAQMVVNQIVNGGGGMPSFGDQLSDEQIAAVASYIRTHWGNSFGEVSPDQVSGQQGQ